VQLLAVELAKQQYPEVAAVVVLTVERPLFGLQKNEGVVCV
jgi:hypothetical protein